MIAPEGNPHDGLLDLCLAKNVGKMKALYLISRFMQGTQYSHPAIQGRRAARVLVRAEKGTLPVHADGETIATHCDQVEIELLAGQLEMYLPDKGD